MGRAREHLPAAGVREGPRPPAEERRRLDSGLMDARRVAILGAGTIGESLLRGLLSGGWREPGEIVATVHSEERARELEERHGVRVTLSNAEAVAGAALVVIAVKPQDFDSLLGE